MPMASFTALMRARSQTSACPHAVTVSPFVSGTSSSIVMTYTLQETASADLDGRCDQRLDDVRLGRLGDVVVEPGCVGAPLILLLSPSRERDEDDASAE